MICCAVTFRSYILSVSEMRDYKTGISSCVVQSNLRNLPFQPITHKNRVYFHSRNLLFGSIFPPVCCSSLPLLLDIRCWCCFWWKHIIGIIPAALSLPKPWTKLDYMSGKCLFRKTEGSPGQKELLFSLPQQQASMSEEEAFLEEIQKGKANAGWL